MKKTLAVWLTMSLLVVGLGEVSQVQGEVWINPLFKEHGPANKGPLVKLSDGSLMIVAGKGTRTSKDKGITWSEPRPIYQGEKPGIPDGGLILRTREGVIVVMYTDSSTTHWEWDEAKGEAKDPRMDTWAIRSLDDGKTWVDRQLIQKGYCQPMHSIQTRSGHIVVPVQRLISDPVRWGTSTCVSEDNGKTWRRSNLIDMGGVGLHDGVIEPTVVELKDGRLYMLMRTAWDRLWEAYSWDKGLSWRQVGPSNIPTASSAGYITRLASGRIALVWTSPLPGGKPRPLAEVLSYPPPRKAGEYYYVPTNMSLGVRQVSITFSDDEMKTWTKPIVVGRESKGGLRDVYLFEPEPGLLWIKSGGSHSNIAVSGREAELVESVRKEEGNQKP